MAEGIACARTQTARRGSKSASRATQQKRQQLASVCARAVAARGAPTDTRIWSVKVWQRATCASMPVTGC